MTNLELITEICKEKDIQLECLSFGYIMCITAGEKTRHIFGPYWGLNSAAADRIACDKTACYIILEKSGIPAIAHELLYNPLKRMGWAGEKGAWAMATDFFIKHNKRVVIKPNQGTKGQDVYLCETVPALEAAVYAIFQEYPDAALSPYYEIENEYRVFFLNGNAMFAYGKAKKDSWQHNLSQGAIAFELRDEKIIAKVNGLAVRAAKCIGITFATVDIAETVDGELFVMEINAGVQARQLLEQLPHLRAKIKKIYAAALQLLVDGV